MGKYFSYYRVSSQEQGIHGASLEAQREANVRYAETKGFEIVAEYREVQSAAKSGKRREFFRMLKDIESTKNIKGIIFHDVDRSSRSIYDWAQISKLTERGFEMHFSRDGSDLSSRASKLTNNIKAVVAADYIENLSQETKKGLYKKLEQGFSVVGAATIGYKSVGQGKREIDPIQAPLVKEAFKLYATGKYTLADLADNMYKKGLRSVNGNKVDKTKIDRMLKKKFYIGLIEVKGKIFKGIHEPLIPLKLFNEVQDILKRRYSPKVKKSLYLFPHLIKCSLCGNTLKTMTSKDKYKYYYCRNKNCEMTAISEEIIERKIIDELNKIKFSTEEAESMLKLIKESKRSAKLAITEKMESTKLHIEKQKARLANLLDMKLDKEIGSDVFERKKKEIYEKLKELEDQVKEYELPENNIFENIQLLVKLLSNPVYAYKKADYEGKIDLLKSMSYEILACKEKLIIKWQEQFQKLINKTLNYL